MRISDWSSDVCSSDLEQRQQDRAVGRGAADALAGSELAAAEHRPHPTRHVLAELADEVAADDLAHGQVVPEQPDGALPRHRDRHHAHSGQRSEEHTSVLQSLMRISYAVLCLNTRKQRTYELST